MSPSISPTPTVPATANNGADPQRNFRFFDNRQKYLLFVHTCSEKWVIANRVARLTTLLTLTTGQVTQATTIFTTAINAR